MKTAEERAKEIAERFRGLAFTWDAVLMMENVTLMAIRQAVADERERCAKIADTYVQRHEGGVFCDAHEEREIAANSIARDIRALIQETSDD